MNSRILPIFALLVAVGIFFAYVNPTWSGAIATTRAAIASDDRALDAAGEYRAQQNQLASARNAINPADMKRLSTFFPDSADNVGLILNLNALAARSGLSLSNIDVTDNAPDAGLLTSSIHSVDLALSAVGTYAALQSFLRDIEKNARLLDARDLVIKGSGTGVYSYQMTLRFYWLHNHL